MSSLSATSRLALLMITSARLFTTRKPVLTTIFIISPHILVIAKQVSLAVNSCDFAIFVLKNQTFWKRVVKWSPLFEQRGQSHALLQNDLQAIRQIERIDVLNNHRPSNQSSDRILLVLTYHPLNERIKIMLCGENVQRKRLEMRLIFHLGTSHPRGLNSDFPSALRGRMQSARTAFFFSSFMAKAKIATFVLCNSTDEGPGPKCLEKNTNQNTALLFIIFLFFFLFLTFPYVLLNILITNFRLYTKYTYR